MADKPVDSPEVGWYSKTFGAHAAPDSTGRILREQMGKGVAIVPYKDGGSALKSLIAGAIIAAPVLYSIDQAEVKVDAQSIEAGYEQALSSDIGYRAGHFQKDDITVIVEHDNGLYRVYTAPTDGSERGNTWQYVSDASEAARLIAQFAQAVEGKIGTLNGDFSRTPPYDPRLVRFEDVTRVFQDPEDGTSIRRKSTQESNNFLGANLRQEYTQALSELRTAISAVADGQYGFRDGEIAAEQPEITPRETIAERATLTAIFIGGYIALGGLIGVVRTTGALAARGHRRRREKKTPSTR